MRDEHTGLGCGGGLGPVDICHPPSSPYRDSDTMSLIQVCVSDTSVCTRAAPFFALPCRGLDRIVVAL